MKSPINQCHELEAFLDGRLKGEDRHRFETHLNGCEDCRESSETWQTIKRGYACWVERITSDEEGNEPKSDARSFVTSLLDSIDKEEASPRLPKRKGPRNNNFPELDCRGARSARRDDEGLAAPIRGGATPPNGMDRRSKMGSYCSVGPKSRVFLCVAAAATILLGLSLTTYFIADKGSPEPPPPTAMIPQPDQLSISAIIITDSFRKNIRFEGGRENLIEAPGNGRILATVGQDRFGLDRLGKMRIKAVTSEQTTIRLIQGKAAFGVSPKLPGSRFIVEAGEVTVEVIGTRFSVSTGDNCAVTVSVEEGNVSVFAKNWCVHLEAGSSITVEEGVALPVKAANLHEVETLTELLSDNVASASERDKEGGIQSPSRVTPSIRNSKTIEHREKTKSPQKNLDAWRNLIIKGEVGTAEDRIRSFLRVFPADVDALMLLANCQKRQDRYRDAVETYERIIASGDERVANRARYLAAELSFSKLRNLNRAVALIDDYLRHTPPNTPNRADARLMQAEALLGIEASDRAKRVLQELVKDYGRTPIANQARELLGQLPDEAEEQK